MLAKKQVHEWMELKEISLRLSSEKNIFVCYLRRAEASKELAERWLI